MSITTWNPNEQGWYIALSNNNLTVTGNGTSRYSSVKANVGKYNRKWYWEVTIDSLANGYIVVGISDATFPVTINNYIGSENYKTVGWHSVNGKIYHDSTYTSNNYNFNVGDVLGILLDYEGNTISFFKNGTFQYTQIIENGFSSWGAVYPAISVYGSSKATINFGLDGAFKYDIPMGYHQYQKTIKHLIQQGTNIYSIKDSLCTRVGQVLPTDDMFLNYGVGNLDSLTSILTQDTAYGVDKGNLANGKYFEFNVGSTFKTVNSVT